MKLIDKLLDNAKEVVDKAKRPFIKKKLTRAFESAIDNAEEQKTDAELKIQDLREKLVKEPENAESILNDLIDQKILIVRADRTIEVIKEEKKVWFAEIK